MTSKLVKSYLNQNCTNVLLICNGTFPNSRAELAGPLVVVLVTHHSELGLGLLQQIVLL